MQQTLNLYKHLEQEDELLFSAVHMLAAAAITLALLFVYAAYGFYQQHSLDSRLAEAREQSEALQTRLAKLKSTEGLPGLSEDNVESLNSQIVMKRRILQFMKAGDAKSIELSGFFEGLSRQRPKGLWLEEIAIKSAGADIALQGVMVKASLLPDYLAALGNEKVFKGLTFNSMKIEDIEKQRQSMRFNVRVNREGVLIDE